jgi:hypothetical protein
MYINMSPHSELLARRCVCMSERQIGRRVETNGIAISPVEDEAEEGDEGEDDGQRKTWG